MNFTVLIGSLFSVLFSCKSRINWAFALSTINYYGGCALRLIVIRIIIITSLLYPKSNFIYLVPRGEISMTVIYFF